MKKFSVTYANEPNRNKSFKVRGVCRCDVLNPCWDNRKGDVPGQHWGGGPACQPCTDAARRAQRAQPFYAWVDANGETSWEPGPPAGNTWAPRN